MTTPGLETRYRVPRWALEGTRELLLPSAHKRVEGVVVWWGRMVDAHVAQVVSAYRPRQVAHRSAHGLSVTVPPDAISDMIVQLPPATFVAARLHTHGTAAYHSEMDDRNMLIAHAGAISIVVPHFARDPIDLKSCSVNMLHPQRGWLELSLADVARRFAIVDD
jgi:hypothetical protein